MVERFGRTLIVAAALVAGCGDGATREADSCEYRGVNTHRPTPCTPPDVFFLNFGPKEGVTCGQLRGTSPFPETEFNSAPPPYSTQHYCAGKPDDAMVATEAFVGSPGLQRRLRSLFANFMRRLGIEVVEEPPATGPYNQLDIGGVGEGVIIGSHRARVIKGKAPIDRGNQSPSDKGFVTDRSKLPQGTITCASDIVARAALHEAAHMLGLDHPPASDTEPTLMSENVAAEDQCPVLNLNDAQAETLAQNLIGSCAHNEIDICDLIAAAQQETEALVQDCQLLDGAP